jgi:hypothetical protein
LSYELGGYAMLAAVIGLDSGAGGHGDCIFMVHGDGRELFSKRMRGKDAPYPLKLDIAGVTRLTLTVDWGENLDIGDHANWCDARVIKQ